MDIKNIVKVARAAASASASACKRPEYMEACLASFPFLSPQERVLLGREYAEAVRAKGIWVGSVKTLPSQTRVLLRAARAALRGEEAWRLVASPRVEEILREELRRAGFLPDPRRAALHDLEVQIAQAEVQIASARTLEERDALHGLIADLRAYRDSFN
jgi:hypothetical protein